jgi:glycosyltransferase involved in cell wall biosynthesis
MLPAIAQRMAARRQGKLVVWCQDVWPEIGTALGLWRAGGMVERLLQRVNHSALRAADAVIALGERMAEHIAAAGVARERIHVIPNWVQPGLLDRDVEFRAMELRAPMGLSLHQFVVRYSGNLGRVHEFETVAAAVKQLQRRSDIHFLFSGEGPRRAEAQRLLEGLERIHFVPAVPANRFAFHLLAGDAHLVTLREGFDGLSVPSKAASAWAVGRPTIFVGPERSEIARATREGKVGIAVANGDVDALVVLIEALADDAAFRRQCGQNARAWAKQHHDPATNVNRIVELLRSL